MFVVDMHCDTLMLANETASLIKKYNTSNRYPFLQFFANFHPCGKRPAEVRRAETFKTLELYEKLLPAYVKGILGILVSDEVKKSLEDLLRACEEETQIS